MYRPPCITRKRIKFEKKMRNFGIQDICIPNTKERKSVTIPRAFGESLSHYNVEIVTYFHAYSINFIFSYAPYFSRVQMNGNRKTVQLVQFSPSLSLSLSHTLSPFFFIVLSLIPSQSLFQFFFPPSNK